jgi:hypothetical protein
MSEFSMAHPYITFAIIVCVLLVVDNICGYVAQAMKSKWDRE